MEDIMMEEDEREIPHHERVKLRPDDNNIPS